MSSGQKFWGKIGWGKSKAHKLRGYKPDYCNALG
jgi:hypothetical protein